MLNIKTVAVGALLAASAAATSVNDRVEARDVSCHPKGLLRRIRATYDDLKFSDEAIPVGIYKELSYNNFYVDQYDGFIHPSSGVNSAISFDPSLKRTVTVTRPGDTFDLKSLTFACVSGYPQDDCTVRIRGDKPDGVTWMANVITYPALDNAKPFVFKKVEFDPKLWTGLSRIEFEYAKLADGRDAALNIDDLTYEKRGCK